MHASRPTGIRLVTERNLIVDHENHRQPLLDDIYEDYLVDQQSAEFVRRVTGRYSIATLQRLARTGQRMTRRGAVLALGLLADYESNHVIGCALADDDRGVRMLAENAIRAVWHRAGNELQRDQLKIILKLISAGQHVEAIDRATQLIEQAPWFAEVWNQRAIAYYQLERYSESIRDCHQTLEINPYHFAAAAGMGQSYLKLNEPVAALECFRRALRLNPNLEGVRTQVVYLQRTLKDESARDENPPL